MARPRKTGLGYFPLDVDFFDDEKIVAISGEFGIKGELTAIKLLCAIYRNGYFIEWSDMLRMKMLRSLAGVSPELLDSIVNRLVKWDFFDKALFDSAKILTSRGIQKRFFEASKRWTGKSIDANYLLVDVSASAKRTSPRPTESSAPPSSTPSQTPRAPAPSATSASATPSQPYALTIEDEVPLLKADSSWLASVSNRYSIPHDELVRYLDHFVFVCSKTHTSLQDCKSHFCRWLAKQPKDTEGLRQPRSSAPANSYAADRQSERAEVEKAHSLDSAAELRAYLESRGLDAETSLARKAASDAKKKQQ